MDHLNLYFNNYYPFYTLETRGKKKYSYQDNVIMHLSLTKRIYLKISYDGGKLRKVEISKSGYSEKSFYPDKQTKYISYPEFSSYVKIIEYRIRKALRTLAKKKAYRKIFIFSCLYKFDDCQELEADYEKIELEFSKSSGSVIKDGKMMIPKETTTDTSEESEIMRKVGNFLEQVNDNTTYRELTDLDFNEQFTNYWERLAKYLEAPKFLRKKEYQL